jgi:hypothetical protein
VLEVRYASADGRLHIARKLKHHDDWDPPIAAYDLYGPGVTGNASTSLMTEASVTGDTLRDRKPTNQRDYRARKRRGITSKDGEVLVAE